MRFAVVAFPLVALAACGGGNGDPGDQRPSGLVSAAARGDVGSVRRLLADGAPVNTRDRDGRTAVTAAALGDHVDVVRVLIDAGADVDLQDAERNNPLLVCGVTGNVAMLREVLRADPDVRLTNRFGGTALIPASERGHVDMVRALLRTGIDVDHVNRLGWTALLEAVILGDGGPAHRQIVQLLVDAGAEVGLADRDGVTALEHARERGYDEIARTLKAAGGGAS
jgi:ankyrin repeat protein